MGNIVQYEHHGQLVSVDEDLKGTHREHCLCFRCARFTALTGPREANCPISNKVFTLCVEHNLCLPVFECPEFRDLKDATSINQVQR